MVHVEQVQGLEQTDRPVAVELAVFLERLVLLDDRSDDGGDRKNDDDEDREL